MEEQDGLEGEGEGEGNGGILGPCLTSYVDPGTSESHRYYLARRTVMEMLRDRGYVVPNSEVELSLQDFRDIHGQNPDLERLRISTTLRSDPLKRILVIFCGPSVVKVHMIRSIAYQIVNKDTLGGLILIVQNHITAQALKAVDLFPFKAEIFQLPRMLRKDAIARYYGLEKGQVVKVSYGGENEITESHVTYRCVW
ncbi:hypothetical protein I3843_10G038400 [Carya illinoinensis]|uniref:DNA-directed RNA polymerase V subunit 5A-like isoform X2 n=1 Tax=Carya illinoinensis TaxID=32201 RepID=UPI001C71D946|nr:DNA-directed RNA polymerase V subunit 5A-like isoform X2 [Carya illinoinensis]KAG7958828.1 hypothetical protein I3843_10G038400 [Carya illinoinensis]